MPLSPQGWWVRCAKGYSSSLLPGKSLVPGHALLPTGELKWELARDMRGAEGMDHLKV